MNKIWACVYAPNAKYFKIYGLRDAIIIISILVASKYKQNGQNTPWKPTYVQIVSFPFRSRSCPGCPVSPSVHPSSSSIHRIPATPSKTQAHWTYSLCAVHTDRPDAHSVRRSPFAVRIKSYFYWTKQFIFALRSTVVTHNATHTAHTPAHSERI